MLLFMWVFPIDGIKLERQKYVCESVVSPIDAIVQVGQIRHKYIHICTNIFIWVKLGTNI